MLSIAMIYLSYIVGFGTYIIHEKGVNAILFIKNAFLENIRFHEQKEVVKLYSTII